MRGECITWRIAQRFGQLRRLCHGGKRAAQLFEGQRCSQLWGRCGRQRGWWCWCWCGWWVIAERVRAQMCWKIVIHTCIARRGGGDQSDAICSWPVTRGDRREVRRVYRTGVRACDVRVRVHVRVRVRFTDSESKPNQNQTQRGHTQTQNTHTDIDIYWILIFCILQGRDMYSNYLLLLLFVPDNKRKFN